MNPTQGSGSGGAPGTGAGISLDMSQKGSVVIRVFGPDGAPLKEQSFIRLYAINSQVQLSGALTNLDSSVSFNNLPGSGWYSVEVSAAGYRTEKKEFNISEQLSFFEVDVTLQLDTENSGVKHVSVARLPPKVQKHVDKGVAEFRAGDLKGAQKELSAAYRAAPSSSETNYLLGTLYLRTKNLPKAEKHLATAISLDPGDVPALLVLAHLRYQQDDLERTRDLLQKALVLDRKQWEALWLLSEIDYRQHNFEKARQEAADAVDFGKGKANGAEFVEALALSQLGRTEEAVKTLRTFLRDAPADVNAPAARQLAGKLELQGKSAGASNMALVGLNTVPLVTASPSLPALNWEPAGVDEEKLPLAEGVTCPAEQVIQGAGERAAELVESVNRIQAKEEVTHEELSTLGRPVATEKRKFDYFVSITDSDSGIPTVDESRQGDFGPSHFLGHLSMFGLADLPLIFHPRLRGDFQMTCEGLGRWQQRATWILYFRQRPDRPERLRAYELLDGNSYAVGLKGRAWVAADTYQILRLEANLMKPIRQIGLGSEEDVIEYGPVPFKTKNTTLWLPTSADIYFYYRHQPFHRHHEFTKYQLFSVSASAKMGQPIIPPEKDNH